LEETRLLLDSFIALRVVRTEGTIGNKPRNST